MFGINRDADICRDEPDKAEKEKQYADYTKSDLNLNRHRNEWIYYQAESCCLRWTLTLTPDLEVMRWQVEVWRIIIEAKEVSMETGDQGGGQTQVDTEERWVVVILKTESLIFLDI